MERPCHAFFFGCRYFDNNTYRIPTSLLYLPIDADAGLYVHTSPFFFFVEKLFLAPLGRNLVGLDLGSSRWLMLLADTNTRRYDSIRVLASTKTGIVVPFLSE